MPPHDSKDGQSKCFLGVVGRTDELSVDYWSGKEDTYYWKKWKRKKKREREREREREKETKKEGRKEAKAQEKIQLTKVWK